MEITRCRKSRRVYGDGDLDPFHPCERPIFIEKLSPQRNYGSWLEATSTTRSRGSTRDMRQKACKSCGISAFYGQERRFEDR